MARYRKIIFTALLVPFLVCAVEMDAETGEDGQRRQAVIAKIVEYLKTQKVASSEVRLRAIARHVYQESVKYDIDYRLVLALMKVESNFKHNAVSRKGAMGLLQVKPSTGETVARDIGMEWKGPSQLHEPDNNIKIGVHYFAQLLKFFETVPSALQAYNKGSARVKGEAARPTAQNARFTSAVLKEYSKTLALLPDP